MLYIFLKLTWLKVVISSMRIRKIREREDEKNGSTSNWSVKRAKWVVNRLMEAAINVTWRVTQVWGGARQWWVGVRHWHSRFLSAAADVSVIVCVVGRMLIHMIVETVTFPYNSSLTSTSQKKTERWEKLALYYIVLRKCWEEWKETNPRGCLNW